MGCSTCTGIPAALTANTGRDELLPTSTRVLAPLGLGDREDLWECRECGALYLWEDLSSQSGSGNNDEETLTRVAAGHLPVVRRLLGRDAAGGDPAALADSLFELPAKVIDLVLARACREERATIRALVPRLVAELARRDWLAANAYSLRDVLSTLAASEPDEARRILDAIEATPYTRPHLLDQVAERCRRALAERRGGDPAR
jgi:hypothetical protein